MVDQIPVDILKEILLYLTDVKSLHFAQLACKQWRGIIVELKLIEKCLGGIQNIPKIYDFNDWGKSGLTSDDFCIGGERKLRKKLSSLGLTDAWEKLDFCRIGRGYERSPWGHGDVRVAIIGQGGSGKSASTIMYIQNHFIDEYDPTIEDSYRKQVTFLEKTLLLDILDTAGCEDFSAMRHQYLLDSEIIICLFALDNRESLVTARSYLEHERIRSGKTEERPNQAQEKGDNSAQADIATRRVLIVGNKCDLPRQISHAEAVAFAREMRAGYIETSAKENKRIQEAFQECIKYSMCRRVLSIAKDEGLKSRNRCGIQ